MTGKANVVDTLFTPAAGILAGLSAVAWLITMNDNAYAEKLKDIDTTPHLWLIAGLLCLGLIWLERIRGELHAARRGE